MLRITGWSLLLGAAALLAGLTLFYAPPSSDPPTAPALWSLRSGKVITGSADVVDSGVQLTLNELGNAVISLPLAPVAAQQYTFLHVALEHASADLRVMLNWVDGHDKQRVRLYPLENHSHSSQWIATAELEGWSGGIDAVSLLLFGQPGETVKLKAFALHGASPLRQLQAIYSDVTAYGPWNRATMNTYTGAMKVSSFYPVPLAAALFLLAVLAYGAMVILSRGRLRFSRVNVALMFLACYILLDITWQTRLWHQLADTLRTFAGVEPQRKQAVGPDAPLVDFVSQIRPRLSADSRVFVASSDHYNGMRVAYYLFPLNVYWSVHDPQVPYDEFLRKGDYIALIQPSTFRFDVRQGVLIAEDRANIPAERVFVNAVGTLVRLR